MANYLYWLRVVLARRRLPDSPLIPPLRELRQLSEAAEKLRPMINELPDEIRESGAESVARYLNYHNNLDYMAEFEFIKSAVKIAMVNNDHRRESNKRSF